VLAYEIPKFQQQMFLQERHDELSSSYPCHIWAAWQHVLHLFSTLYHLLRHDTKVTVVHSIDKLVTSLYAYIRYLGPERLPSTGLRVG
jgi:hypothetical protein